MNDLIRSGDGDDLSNGGIGNDIISGQGGNDTADYSDLTFNGVNARIAGLDVSLAQREARHSSNNNGLTWKDTLDTIENVTGTSRNDRFISDNQDNVFDGQGEVGRSDRQTTFDDYQVTADVVEYGGIQSDFTFSGSAYSFIVTRNTEQDTLIDIEFVKFDSGLVATTDLFA